MAHEFGHTLGLAHPVRGPNSGILMECYLAKGENASRSNDDLFGEMYIYSGHSPDFGAPGQVIACSTQ